MLWRNFVVKKLHDFLCFSSIELNNPLITGRKVTAKVILKSKAGKNASFTIRLTYEEEVDDSLLPLIRLAFVMPLLNYGLFSEEIQLDFPISKKDFDILNEFNRIFSKDIFVNKFLRRRADYILPEYLPNPEKIDLKDANPKAVIKPDKITDDMVIANKFNKKSCGILSSGGKESLLTYGMLNQMGCTTYPLYVNESGGHWRTALPAYRYHKQSDKKTRRVWTNIDRFYLFMLDNLAFIRSDHRKIRADTYPIRLCIFPFYVFLLLPLFVKNEIGNLLIGSEFDDLRSTPEYKGITHYYGIYDQHQDFDKVMNKWYEKRLPGLVQWSAVRNISGLIVERILVKQFPNLAQFQRSCHSCHFENKEIIPCGSCSKCMGVLLFLLSNNANPRMMKFKEMDIVRFSEKINPDALRLDEDEKLHSFYLMGKYDFNSQPIDHVEKIHLNKDTCDINMIPMHLRKDVLNTLKKFTTGYCKLKDNKWVSLAEEDIYF